MNRNNIYRNTRSNRRRVFEIIPGASTRCKTWKKSGHDFIGGSEPVKRIPNGAKKSFNQGFDIVL